MTNALGMWFPVRINETMHLSCTVIEICGFKDNGVTSLTSWGHVTPLVTSPMDLPTPNTLS